MRKHLELVVGQCAGWRADGEERYDLQLTTRHTCHNCHHPPALGPAWCPRARKSCPVYSIVPFLNRFFFFPHHVSSSNPFLYLTQFRVRVF